MRAEARVALRLAFSHHPLCRWFSDDRLGPFCSGCALFWPSFLLTTPVVLVALARGADGVAVFLAGVVLGLPQLATAVRRFSRPLRGAIKVLGGAGVAVATPAILFLPLPLAWRILLYGLELVAFCALLVLRMRSILRTCDACSWRRDWARCPGFGALDA